MPVTSRTILRYSKGLSHIFLLATVVLSALPLQANSENPPNSISAHPLSDLYDASLFLSQAGFGGQLTEIENVLTMGEKKWLDKQMSLTPSYHTADSISHYNEYCKSLNVDDCENEDFLWRPIFRRFVLWDRVVNAEDQLNQKVAYALSQIFVVSEAQDELENLEALTHWWDTLLKHGLGNYRDLLEAVTLSPAMGTYLSHYANDKGDSEKGVFPDENYAREVMQLFSIGLYELNQDGSRKTDSGGEPIPSYDNRDIKEFARIFTGLANGCGEEQFFDIETEADFTCSMNMYEDHHDKGAKLLFNKVVVPENQKGLKDIKQALDALFLHENTAPFFSRLLIKRLVKSNPTPAYISRVASSFRNNGSGVRGDMKAVMSAILTDPEAKTRNYSSGKVRDPFLRFAHLYRALSLKSKTGKYFSGGWFMDQNLKQMPLMAPSVFNFYSPYHRPFGEAGDQGLYSPELQITNSFTAPKYYEAMQTQVMWDYQGEEEGVGEDLVLDYSKLSTFSENPKLLANYLDILFTHGQMTNITRDGIRDIVKSLADEPELAIKASVYFTVIAPEYIVRQ